MGQVLSNLMGNAVQYCHGTKPVSVTIPGNDSLALFVSVHNFGPAIPAESQWAIFPVVDARPSAGFG
jgi:signal transduction histidine kinase